MLEKRFPDMGMNCPLCRAANYLDPRFKGLHLIESNLLEKTKAEIEIGWKESHVEISNSENEDNVIVQAKSVKEPMSPNSKLRGKIHLRTEAIRKTMQSQIMKKMDRYEVFSTLPKDIHSLSWWKSHNNILLILANIARSKLAIPASAVMSERVFPLVLILYLRRERV